MHMSRGKDVMDDYDLSYTSLQYHYEKSNSPEDTSIFSKALYLIQMAMVVGSGIVIGGAIVAERNGIQFCPLPFGSMEKELIYVPFACGAMSAITAFVGCVGAKSRNKCILVLYLICITTAFVLSVATTAQAFADQSNVYYYAQRQWKGLTRVQEIQFQRLMKCCNFITKGPCCRFYPGNGECANKYTCFDIVSPHLVDQFNIIGITGLIQSFYLFAVMLFTLILCKYIDYYHTNTKNNLNKNTNTTVSTDWDPIESEIF
eukprot:530818_1